MREMIRSSEQAVYFMDEDEVTENRHLHMIMGHLSHASHPATPILSPKVQILSNVLSYKLSTHLLPHNKDNNLIIAIIIHHHQHTIKQNAR